MKIFLYTFLVLIVVGILSGCSAGIQTATIQPSEEIHLTPYYTATLTPSVTPTPQGLPTSTLKPTLTPTPRIYTVKANDTLITIAYAFGVTLQDLQAANPEVKPELLSIGTKLIIPAPNAITGTPAAATPTPFSVTMNEATCLISLSGGYHCYALVQNEKKNPAENLLAVFTLTDPVSGDTVTQAVPLSLKQLTPGSKLPFYAYFAPPIFKNARATIQLVTATKATTENPSIFPLTINGLKQEITGNGLSALISGSAVLNDGEISTSHITLVAVAYDSAGNVVGMRQIEQDLALKGGDSSNFSFEVYSNSGKIALVEVLGEASK